MVPLVFRANAGPMYSNGDLQGTYFRFFRVSPCFPGPSPVYSPQTVVVLYPQLFFGHLSETLFICDRVG